LALPNARAPTWKSAELEEAETETAETTLVSGELPVEAQRATVAPEKLISYAKLNQVSATQGVDHLETPETNHCKFVLVLPTPYFNSVK